MAVKTCEDFLSLGVHSLKSYLNVWDVATSRYSKVELDILINNRHNYAFQGNYKKFFMNNFYVPELCKGNKFTL